MYDTIAAIILYAIVPLYLIARAIWQTYCDHEAARKAEEFRALYPELHAALTEDMDDLSAPDEDWCDHTYTCNWCGLEAYMPETGETVHTMRLCDL
jgi:hypothetical protein